MAFKDAEKKRETEREYRAKNKERIAETKRKHYAKNRERTLDAARKWRAENKERAAAGFMITGARKRAVKKGLPFDLDGRQEEIEGIVLHGGCHYTGLPFNVEGGLTWDSPSLDRVEPELGYVWSNVRVVLSCINSFKGADPLEKMCFVAEHLLDWQAAKAAQTTGSVLLFDQQNPTKE